MTPVALSKPQWAGRHALGLAHELNERCLTHVARLCQEEGARSPVAVIRLYESLWRQLDALAYARAARFPFLILNMRFQDDEWWCRARDGTMGRGLQSAPPPAWLPGRRASELTRETLMLAWRIASAGPRIAAALFGMSSPVASILADLRPQDVERIAARQSRHLRLRWEDNPAFWHGFLLAACGRDDGALREVHIHGLQLLGAELMASGPPPPRPLA